MTAGAEDPAARRERILDMAMQVAEEAGWHDLRLRVVAERLGLPLGAVPGPNAAVTALTLSGLPPHPFLFHGFLPPKSGARRAQLQALATLPCALVFYEAPHRIEETLADMAATLDSKRPVTLARELTKKFESIVTLPLAEAPAWLAADPNHARGEFVVVVHPPRAAATASDAEALRVLDILAAELPPPLAAKLAAKITGRTKAELYQMTLAHK